MRSGNEGLPKPSADKPLRDRRFFVHGFIATLLAGSLYCSLWGKDLWPFSSYAMYSRLEKDLTLEVMALYVVTGAGETPIWGGCNLPQGYYRLRYWLKTSYEDGERRHRLIQVLAKCLANVRRTSPHSNWASLRLYRHRWDLAGPTVSGPERELLLEVRP